MIIVKLWGGLGNQLFQYVFGQYIAQQLNTEVIYLDQTKKNSAKNFTNRNNELDYFQLGIQFVNNANKEKNTPEISRLKRKMIQEFPFLSEQIYIQKLPHSFIDKFRNHSYYEGYWQNLKYVDALKLTIQKQVSPRKDFYETHKNLLEEIENENSASIHIRRDDYLNIKANTKIYHVCDMDYYQQAISLLKKKKDVKHFYIFTQDLDWAKENFQGNEFTLIKDNSPIEDLFLMSFCKHNIIANSTFSWWGAWLNKNEDKLVVAPQNWYKNSLRKSINNMIPEEWIRI